MTRQDFLVGHIRNRRHESQNLWRLVDAATCCGAHIEVNSYLHVLRLVESFYAGVCCVLGLVPLKCIEHSAQ